MAQITKKIRERLRKCRSCAILVLYFIVMAGCIFRKRGGGAQWILCWRAVFAAGPGRVRCPTASSFPAAAIFWPPCLRCPACGKVLRGTHPDCVTAEDSQHKDLSVEVLRALRSDAYIQPNEGACKVFLFPDCRRLTVQDQNVLLKLVEEGPAYAAFLFCAENPSVLLPTVRSRCAELSVRPTEQEAAAPSPEALALLEAMSGGESPAVTRVLVGFENGKMTREKLQQVLWECREGSLQALRLRWGAPPETLCADGVGPLSRRLTKKQLIRLCEMLGKFAQECEWNVAVGQVLGAVAAEWEDIL